MFAETCTSIEGQFSFCRCSLQKTYTIYSLHQKQLHTSVQFKKYINEHEQNQYLGSTHDDVEHRKTVTNPRTDATLYAPMCI